METQINENSTETEIDENFVVAKVQHKEPFQRQKLWNPEIMTDTVATEVFENPSDDLKDI